MGDSIRSLLRRTSSCNRPWQLSAALALGLLCGLLPKASLLFCGLALLCCCLPIHLPLAACTCFLLSFLAGPLTETAGRAGLWSLTHSSLADIWTSLDALPWLPWVGLNNSVVHGSLLIGLGLALPVFFLTRPLASSLSPYRASHLATAVDPAFRHEPTPAVAARNSQMRWKPAAAAAPVLATQDLADKPSAPPLPMELAWDGLAARGASDCSTGHFKVDENTCLELEKLLATCNADHAHDVSATQVAQRAAQMAEYVDELLSACEPEPSTSTSSFATTSPSGSTLFIHQSQQPTVVQPYVQPAEPNREPASSRQAIHTQSVDSRGNTGLAELATRRAAGDAQQADTLRYLLEHLRAIKDKV